MLAAAIAMVERRTWSRRGEQPLFGGRRRDHDSMQGVPRAAHGGRTLLHFPKGWAQARLLPLLIFALAGIASFGPRAARAAEAKKPSYYDVLGVPKDADEKAIKSAYRKMALKWHPDKNPDDKEAAEKKFREVAEAYEVLSNPEQRKQYDLTGTVGGQGGGGGGGGFGGFEGFGGFGGGFKDPKDLFKEMFGNEDPFADFSKFFDDVKTETFGGEEVPGASVDDLVNALVKFYRAVAAADKAKPEKVREVLKLPKWKGKEHKMFDALSKKYQEPQHAAALAELKITFDKFPRGGGGGPSGFGGFGDMGAGFGGFDMDGFPGDIGKMFGGAFGGFGGGMGGGGATTMSFSSFSSSSGGKTVKKETKIEGGRRVTKTIETDGEGTRATLEEEEGGRIKRQTGVRRPQELGSGAGGDEM